MRKNDWGDAAAILTDAANALLNESAADGVIEITCWGAGTDGACGLQAAWRKAGNGCAARMQLAPDGKWSAAVEGDAQAEADLLAAVLARADAPASSGAETAGDAPGMGSIVLRIRMEKGGADRLLMMGETLFEILQPMPDRRVEIVCDNQADGARTLSVAIDSPEGGWRGTLTVDEGRAPVLVSEWLPDGEQSAPPDSSGLARLVLDVTLMMDYAGKAASAA